MSRGLDRGAPDSLSGSLMVSTTAHVPQLLQATNPTGYACRGTRLMGMSVTATGDNSGTAAAEAPFAGRTSIHAFNALERTERVGPPRACETRAPSPINKALRLLIKGWNISLYLTFSATLSKTLLCTPPPVADFTIGVPSRTTTVRARH